MISIQDAEAEDLLDRIARRTGRRPAEVIVDLLRAEAARGETVAATGGDAVARTRQLWRELEQRPVLDPRPLDDVLGYDETGLP